MEREGMIGPLSGSVRCETVNLEGGNHSHLSEARVRRLLPGWNS